MSVKKVGLGVAVVSAVALSCNASEAQQQTGKNILLSSLIAQGYEIKAAAVAGAYPVVIVQKGKDVFGCLFFGVGQSPWTSSCERIE
jgi:hypothetical protein